MAELLDPGAPETAQAADTNVWDWLASFTDDLIVTGGQLLGGTNVTGTDEYKPTGATTEPATNTTTWLIIGGAAVVLIILIVFAFKKRKK